jgi:hypothetical protein
VWGVRKACADVFMPVSCVCSPTVRQAELSPIFINLLRDQSRWVRMAAFQVAAPFFTSLTWSYLVLLIFLFLLFVSYFWFSTVSYLCLTCVYANIFSKMRFWLVAVMQIHKKNYGCFSDLTFNLGPGSMHF